MRTLGNVQEMGPIRTILLVSHRTEGRGRKTGHWLANSSQAARSVARLYLAIFQ
jgi:hypothetical protein